MASTNQSPQYQKAETNFLASHDIDDKLYWLDQMIKLCPKHKSAEKMLANLKTRRKKLLKQQEKQEKIKKSGGKKSGIKKEGMQAVIIGFTNTGKSSLLNFLTNVKPEIREYKFTTKIPLVGMMQHSNVPVQLIEIPSIESEFYDKGLVNTTDLIIVLVNSLEQIEKILPKLERTSGKKLIAFNLKRDLDSRKMESTLASKKYNYVVINTKTGENIEALKEKIFNSFDKIRVYTKEPGKPKSEKPLIMETCSTITDIAKKIIKNPYDIKETKIWGPSSKFPGQIVGLSHVLKDLDVVEFKTR